MSDLYKIRVPEQTIVGNKIILEVEAVNHEDQEIPTKSLFYFAIIGDIYWEFSKKEAYGFGIIDEKRDSQKIEIENEYLNNYIDAARNYQKNYEGKILATLENRAKISKLLKVKILNESRNENNCLLAKIEIYSEIPLFLNLWYKIKRFGTAIDQNYL